MVPWTVELSEDFIEDLELRRGVRFQNEVLAIVEGFRIGGPEAFGARPFDLEGVPAWDDLSSPVSFLLPEPYSSGRRSMRIEISPGRKIIIVWID